MIPASPDQIRDAIERQNSTGTHKYYPATIIAADQAIVQAAAKAFAEHMESQPVAIGDLDLKFEPGKYYATRGEGTAYIRTVDLAPPGRIIGMVGGMATCWHGDGTLHGGGHGALVSPYDLIPREVKPELKELFEPYINPEHQPRVDFDTASLQRQIQMENDGRTRSRWSPGHTYHTRSLGLATVLRTDDNDKPGGVVRLIGQLMRDGTYLNWFSDSGKVEPPHEGAADLMEGIVGSDSDDGPREIHEPEYQPRRGTEQVLVAADRLEVMARRIEAQSDRMAGIDHEGESVKRRLDSLEKVSNLRTDLHIEVVRRLDAIEKVVSFLDRWQKSTQAAADGATIRGKTAADEVERSALKWIHEMSGAWSRTTPAAVVEDMRLCGYQIVMRAPAPAPGKTAAEADHIPGRTRFHGGWVNVWNGGSGTMTLSPQWHINKEDADHWASKDGNRTNRVACIHIDFNEGDGL